MRIQTSRLEKGIIYIVSFFLYSGYYVGLSFFFVAGRQDLSRFYSIPLRLLLMLLMIYFILKNKQKLNVFNFKSAILFLFTVLYFLKILYSESILSPLDRSWFEYIFYYISYVLLPFLFYSSIDIVRLKKTILSALIFSGFLLGVLSFITFRDFLAAGGVSRVSMLVYETGQEIISPLALSYSSALTILLSLYTLIYEKVRGVRLIYIIITLVVCFIMFFLGASRGSLVAILLGSLLFMYFGNIKKKLLFISLFIFSLPLIIFGVNATGSSIFKRTQSTIETGESSGRDVLWQEAYIEFINNPVFGGRIEVSGIYPHNIFLEVLMATGVVGMMIFIIFLTLLLKRGVGLIKINNIYLIAFLIFICGISQHMVTGALWNSITLFAALGMFNGYKIR